MINGATFMVAPSAFNIALKMVKKIGSPLLIFSWGKRISGQAIS
jgi:hypothetical protein